MNTLDRWFRLSENKTSTGTELLAGLTTFLTMAYIIFVQPAVLSGGMSGTPTGMDAGAVTTATCLSAAVATAIMGLYARYPIAQAPGMGANFFFVSVVTALSAESQGTAAWQVALGIVFIAGVLFLVISLLKLRTALIQAVSPSLKNGIAVGIGLFIAFIGLRNAGLIVEAPGTLVALTRNLASPETAVFFTGLLLSAALTVFNVRGAILWGILTGALLAVSLRLFLPAEMIAGTALENLPLTGEVASLPPSLAPTFLKMDILGALRWSLAPYIVMFLFMDVFDTMGTLIGVCEQAGFIKDNQLPRAEKALVSDATGTVLGACLGTSTVTSFIESGAGVQQGGRTGLTAMTVAALFLIAPFFAPLIALVGSYPPITAPALILVGGMMACNVTHIQWNDASESLPAFLTLIGIPLTSSIADGIALGLVVQAVLKLITGRWRDTHWLLYPLAALLLAYFLLLRPE